MAVARATADIAVFESGKYRSKRIARNVIKGLTAKGIRYDHLRDVAYTKPQHRLAIFYGLAGRLWDVFCDYRDDPNRDVLLIDLGYFQRREGGRYEGFHKVAINARHPDSYIMDRNMPDDRWRKLHVPIKSRSDYRDRLPIIVVGMQRRAAEIDAGVGYMEWELAAIQKLRKSTKRPIWYRPKPTDPERCAILGTEYKPGPVTMPSLIGSAFCIVTHHSNVACEALAEGVPVYSEAGAASAITGGSLSDIERIQLPKNRKQFFANLAYCQWNGAEMRNGDMIDYFESVRVV